MKGQWFIISTIFIAFSVFAMSSSLRDFRLLDTASAAGFNEDIHFDNLDAGLQRAIDVSPGDCQQIDENLKDFIYFSQQSNGRIGYVVDVFYNPMNINCGANTAKFDIIMLQSGRYQIWKGDRPEVEGG